MLTRLKYLLYRSKYKYANKLSLKSPVDVLLELSSICNMSCEYCYHNNPNPPFTKGLMELDTALEIIDKSKAAGVHSLKFNWRGESTINPNFHIITKYAARKASGSIFIDRLSNSNFKFPTSRDDIFEGLMAQTKVKISFDSFDKDILEAQRTGAKYDLIFNNIDKFYHMKGRKTKMVIQAVRTQANKSEDFKTMIEKFWPKAELSVRDVVSGRLDKDIEDMEVKKKVQDRIPCLQAFNRLVFDYNGNAYPCCPDIKGEFPLNNIWDKSVYLLFNGVELTVLRNMLKNGAAFKYDPCKNCSSFESYKGYKHGWKS